MTMTTEDKKMYVLKVKYSVIDVSKKKSNRKITRKKEKLYLVRDPESIDEKLKELEDSLLEIDQEERTTFLNRAQEFLRSFGMRCNRTYLNMLRT